MEKFKTDAIILNSTASMSFSRVSFVALSKRNARLTSCLQLDSKGYLANMIQALPHIDRRGELQYVIVIANASYHGKHTKLRRRQRASDLALSKQDDVTRANPTSKRETN